MFYHLDLYLMINSSVDSFDEYFGLAFISLKTKRYFDEYFGLTFISLKTKRYSLKFFKTVLYNVCEILIFGDQKSQSRIKY